MKKRKRQLNTPQQKQREAQEMSEAAKKRQEEDFARQLAAMFRAELGEEKGETAGEAASRGRDHRRTVVVPNLDRQAEASAAAKKDRASADTATFVPAAAPEPAPAEDPMAHPLNVDRLRADIAESLRQAARREELEQTPAEPQTETEPERSAPSEQAARRSNTRRPSRRERRAARREAQAQKAVPQSEGEPEALRGLDHLGSTGTDAAAPVIRAEDYTPSAPEEERPLTISFDAEPDYIAEVSPSEAPWEEDADWSDARLFSALDQVLSGDAYSEALAALYSTPQGPSRPKDSKQALDQWLAYEPPAAETPVPESDAAPTEPAGAKPPKGMACASEHSSPALPAEPRRGSGAERADSVRQSTELPDAPSAEPVGAATGRPSAPEPPAAPPASPAGPDWRKDSLPTLAELFGPDLRDAVRAESAPDAEPKLILVPAEPAPSPEPAPKPERKEKRSWRKWFSVLLHPQVEEEDEFEEYDPESTDETPTTPVEATASRPSAPEPPEAPPAEPVGAKPPKGMACASEHSSPALPAEPRRGSGAERADSVRPSPEIPDETPSTPVEATISRPSAPEPSAAPPAEPRRAEPFAMDGLQLQAEGEQIPLTGLFFETPAEPETEPAVPEPTAPAPALPQEPAAPPEDDYPDVPPVFRPDNPRRGRTTFSLKDILAAVMPAVKPEPAPEPPEAAPAEPVGAKPPKGMACASEHSSPALPAEPRRGSGAERADSVRPPAPEIPDEDSVRPPEGTESSAPGSAVPESASPESPEPPVPEELPVPEEDDFPEPLPVFEDEQEEDPDRSALSLKELLAAAVPMEAAEPPVSGSLRGTGREEKHLLFMDEELSQEPAEPEPPAQTRPGRRSRSARERGKTAPDRRRAVSEDSISVPDEEEPPKTGKHGSLRNLLGGLAAKAHAPAEEAGPKEPEQPEPVPEESPAPQEPVPSASVKRRRPAAEKPRQRPERQSAPEQPEPQPEPRQEPEPEPEEPKLLYPEDGFRKYAKELGGVGTRLILTGLFSILSLFLTLYLSLRWSFLPEVFSGGSTAYMLLVLLAALLISNYPGIRDAFRGIRSKRFSPMLLILAAALFTALDTFGAAKAVRPTYTVVVGALLMVELWGRYDRGMALVTTLKVLRERELAAGVSEVQDTVSGSKGLTRTVPDVERFMQKLETRDFMDKIMSVYTPAALVGGLVITGLIGFGLHRDLIWTGSLVFLGSVPLAGLLAFPRLFLLMARKLSGSHAAICGFHGAEAFGGEHSILIGDEDIFPAGSLALNGFKVYNGSPDRLIAYAAAAAKHSGSAFAPLFDDLLLAHNGRRYTVDTFRFYDSGGIGATIIGDVVLMGSLEFMKRMGVHMDKGTKVRQAVYMSVNGELAAVFAVKYNPPENLRRGLASIAGNRHFKGILVTRTFLGTPGFLKSKFGIPTGSFEYPDTRKRLRLSQAEMKRSGAQGAILARDSFTGFAQAATGGRVLRSATTLGALLAVLSGAIGLLFMGVLASLPAYETATAVNLLLYILAWLAPTLLLTGWGRHF